MNIKAIIFGNKKTRETSKTSSILQNPFVKGAEGRKEWNDRYLNQKTENSHWKIAFFASVGVSIILAMVIGKIATESRVEPFVVETNMGMPYAIKSMQGISEKDNLIVNYVVNQFIINTRTVFTDEHAERALLDKAYAYAADNTLNYLKDYYEKNNPLQMASQYAINVNIINSMPIAKNTWEVTWEETKRSANTGQIVGTSRWVAYITVKFADVNQKYINDNPFGIYVSNITWSQSQL